MLTWRLGGMLVTVGIAWLVTRSLAVAATIGLADTLVKVLASYGHERLWLRIKYGRGQPTEYDI